METVYFNKIIFDNKEFNISYLNINIYKYELCYYLLQKKYINKDNHDEIINVQNLLHIKNNDYINKIHLIAIWHYDQKDNYTEYLLSFTKIVSIEDKKLILTKIIPNNSVNNIYKIRLNGFVNSLNI